MTPERLEEIKKNVDLWLDDDDGSVLELINALEEAWADNHDLSEGIDGMIADREYFEKIAEQAETDRSIAEHERKKLLIENMVLAKERDKQRRHRKWLVQELHGLQDAYNTLEDDRDKWMGQFDEAEHRGLAYMEERDKLVVELDQERQLRLYWKSKAEEIQSDNNKLEAKLKEYEAFNEPLKRVYNENTAEEATPNETTREAIEEAERGEVTTCNDAQTLFTELGLDEEDAP